MSDHQQDIYQQHDIDPAFQNDDSLDPAIQQHQQQQQQQQQSLPSDIPDPDHLDFDAAYGNDISYGDTSTSGMGMGMGIDSGMNVMEDDLGQEQGQQQQQQQNINMNPGQLDPSSGPSRENSLLSGIPAPKGRAGGAKQSQSKESGRKPSTNSKRATSKSDPAFGSPSASNTAAGGDGDSNGNVETLPNQPLTEDEIKRKQNRSRASGRVLPRGTACDFCKRRKLRCNAEKPVCDNCLKNPSRVCVYTQKAPPKSRVKLLSDRVSNLETKLDRVKAEEQAARDADAAARSGDGSGVGGGSGSSLMGQGQHGYPLDAGGSASPNGGGGGGSASGWAEGLGLGTGVGGPGGSGGSAVGMDPFAGLEVEDQVPIPHDLPLQVVAIPDGQDDDGHGHNLGLAGDGDINMLDNSTHPGERRPQEDDLMNGYRDGNEIIHEMTQEQISALEMLGAEAMGQAQRDLANGSGARAGTEAEMMLDEGGHGQGQGSSTNVAAGSTNDNLSEPYLMTLANAAEVAGDQPSSSLDDGSSSKRGGLSLKARRARDLELQQQQQAQQPPVDMEQVVRITNEIEERFSGIEREDNGVERQSDQIVEALFELFKKRAFQYSFTGSVLRLHAALLGPIESRASKSLLYAVLAITTASSPTLLPDILKRYPIAYLATHFLVTAQREFAIATITKNRLLDALQSCVLLVQTLYSQGRILDGALLAAQGVKLAVACGLHQLDVKNVLNPDTQSDPHNNNNHPIGDLPFDLNVMMDNDGIPMMTSAEHMEATQQHQLQQGGSCSASKENKAKKVLSRNLVIGDPEDLAELGERVQLFWSLVWVERLGCIASHWTSSILDTDITTAFPPHIRNFVNNDVDPEYRYTVSDLISVDGIPGDVARKDTGWVLMIKTTILIYRIQRMLALPASSRRDTENHLLRSSCNAFWNSLPEEFLPHPATGRNKKAFAADIIWGWVGRHTINLLFWLDEAVASGSDVLGAAPPLEAAENVVRLARTLNSPDYVKPNFAYVILFNITAKYLAQRSQSLWEAGRTEESKRCYAQVNLILDTMKGLGRHIPLASVYAVEVDGVRRGLSDGGDGLL